MKSEYDRRCRLCVRRRNAYQGRTCHPVYSPVAFDQTRNRIAICGDCRRQQRQGDERYEEADRKAIDREVRHMLVTPLTVAISGSRRSASQADRAHRESAASRCYALLRCDTGCNSKTRASAAAVCPSCNGRRMAQTAAHLVDHVIPPVPMRQWVISVPKRLRCFLADRPNAVAALTRIFIEEIERLLCTAAGPTRAGDRPSVARPRLGAVSFLHRFGSAINHHVHLHACATDGVFVPTCDRPPAGAGPLRTGGSQAGKGHDGFARVKQHRHRSRRPVARPPTGESSSRSTFDRAIFQGRIDELPVIDIHSL